MSGFVHEAALYSGEAEFLAATVPFLREGLERGEAALVVVPERRIAGIRDALGGGGAEQVLFRDMAEVGRNPACIIPAWQEFVDRRAPMGGFRGIGEPALPERSAAALAECRIHERLLNVAFDHGPAWRLLCPYDVALLPGEVVEDARRSHPHLRAPAESEPSEGYAPDSYPLGAALPEPPRDAVRIEFDVAALAAVRRHAARAAERAGLAEDRIGRWVLAANEVATNAVTHGGGRGVLQAWQEPGEVVCEVQSRRRLHDPLAGRRRPASGAEAGRGLWLVNHLCDLVELRSSDAGTTVRLHMSV